MQLDDTICYCFHVSKRKVLNYLRISRPRVASQISQCGGAGTGCGWCVPYLKRYFNEMRTGSAPGDGEETVAQAYAAARAAYIRAGHGQPAPGAIPLPDEPQPPS